MRVEVGVEGEGGRVDGGGWKEGVGAGWKEGLRGDWVQCLMDNFWI